MKKNYFIHALIMLLFASCEIDNISDPTNSNQSTDPTEFTNNFGNEITRNFIGEIIDINNLPLSSVAVTIGDQTVLTDNNGIFIINDAIVNERFGYVKANKAGYIHASRAVVPSEGTNKVRIMMLSETVTGTTTSGIEETISLPNGASVALDGNYINEDGEVYSGDVNVIMHFLDPMDDDMEDQMPGMLYAANIQNEERMLKTFGMLAVELRGENGQDLNLAEDSSAEISVPVDESLIATAPNSIPLWHFDEVNGYWIEEGEATLVGNTYVGSVSHFTFWNYDIPKEAVNVCFTLENEIGNKLANVQIVISSSELGQNRLKYNQQYRFSLWYCPRK